MDTSKEYILMCEKAGEIQEIRKNIYIGDYGSDGRGWFLMRDNIPLPRGQFIWLPRQDQLQELVFDKDKDVGGAGLTERFNNWLSFWFELDEQPLDASTWSLEQLWLAFVMKEKYSKQWLADKKEWVKI